MGAISCAGVLVVGPGDTAKPFPTGTATVALALQNTEYTVTTGLVQCAVDSTSAYSTLPGVGTTVAQGLLLYVRVDTPVKLRLTTLTGAEVVPVHGTCLLEFPAADPLTLLELEGKATVEYLAAGQQ